MARSFNGITNQISTSAYTAPAAGTLSCWVNAGSLSNAYNGIIGQVAGGAGVGFFQILLKSTGKFAYYAADTSSNTISLDPGTTSASGWTHVAVTYDASVSSNLKTYVNGSSDGTATGFNNPMRTPSTALGIGVDLVNAGRNYPGSLADAAEWSVALTPLEIAALAKGVRPGRIRPLSLLSWLPLDGLQSPEPDLSGNVHEGTLSGTSASFGPPFTPFTPQGARLDITAAVPVQFRSTLAQYGTRAGVRQFQTANQ